MGKLKDSKIYLILVLIVTMLIIATSFKYAILPSIGIWINYMVIGSVILALLVQIIKYNRAAKREIKIIEGRKRFRTHYADERKKFAKDKNVTFDFPYIHILLKDELIPLLPTTLANTEQLLLLQKDHLQITCNLKTFRQHLAFIKESKKYSAKFYTTELPVKIGLGLWQFQKGQIPLIFPVFVRRQIIAGNIHIWKMETEMYETEMMNSEIKTSEGIFITQHENYCCGDIEFFKYPSCFY